MSGSLEKKQILDKSGFIYHFDRAIYINRKTKKVFSFEVIGDNTPDWLDEKILENNETNDWQFYFVSNPPESVKNELVEMLSK